jgi:hypothetical protein
MNKPVLQILGAMLLHETFQEEMEANSTNTAERYGYALTSAEWQVALKIVQSFKDGELDDAIENVREKCPVWPCNDGALEA